jgi:hypothetical protein
MGPEAKIEHTVVKYAQSKGVLCYKFTSPAHRAVPDRMFVYKGKVMFIEFKKPGGKLTPLQARECRLLAEQGMVVPMVDNVDRGKAVIDILTE